MKHRVCTHRAALCAAVLLALSSVDAFAGQANLDGLRSDVAFDQFIVKYRDGSSERRDPAAIDRGLAQAARAIAGSARQPTAVVRHVRRMSLGADVVRVDRALDRVDAESLMRAIAADPAVEYVEVDARMRPLLTPNDPSYPSQWHYQNNAGGINLPTGWDKSTGTGIVIAVLDTGSTPHSDLNANTVAGWDMISNTTTAQDGNGRDSNPNDPGDWYTNSACGSLQPPSQNSSWHGTHVAGTVAAVTNNASGVAGVAFGARIQHVRVLGRCGGSTSDIADGITWASGGSVSGVPANATPARVINMSLGGSGTCSTTFQNAINGAVGRGATVVVAAGNSNASASNFQPASCANVIAVGANDSNGARASFSNYGTAVDLSAPGVGVLSTLNSGTQAQGTATYGNKSGTSMAAPHVAGVAALVQSRRTAVGLPQFSASQLESHLKTTARPFPATPSQPIGTGIVDADRALNPIQPQAPVVGNVFCSGQGSGYCNVTYSGSNPISIQWSGGNGTPPTDDAYYFGICGTSINVWVSVWVTVSNPYGSASGYGTAYCVGGPEV
jgi:serine protease